MMKRLHAFCFSLIITVSLAAQSGTFWTDVAADALWLQQTDEWSTRPANYRSLHLDFEGLRQYLRQAPLEFTTEARTAPLLLELPLPDGSQPAFWVWESPIMEPELAARFPKIKTYAGKSLSNPHITLRFDQTERGFHAIIHSPEGTQLISPVEEGQVEHYFSYALKDVGFDATADVTSFCSLHEDALPGDESALTNYPESGQRSATVDLYTYRLAIATTAEYSTANGGTVGSVLSAVTSVINQVNSVFEKDNAVRLVLLANTDQTFFFPPNSSDPYTNGNTSTMISENPPVLNAAYGIAGYDIGHVFGVNGGGLANLSSVCNGSANPPSPFPKARGVSGMFGVYVGSLFYIVVGHEVGHQFSATHGFNKCDDENETPSTAYEPGSGSTIMCYNGNFICGTNHLQPITDDYFHINAMGRIRNFTRNGNGSTCATIIAVGNNEPETDISLSDGFYIPVSTPFELTGTATDPEGGSMTYVWEEYDLGPPSPLGMPTGTAPLFRSMIPGTSPTRVFPKMSTIVTNSSDPQEILPFYSRELNFRFTARDNHPGAGAWAFSQVQFNATANAGPFLVIQPNVGGTIWEAGQYVAVTWDVANTGQAPVNCQLVNLLLSTDGGFTYPSVLLANTANDGIAYVVVPDLPTATARIKVEAADNIFFDISNANFTIVPPAQPGFAFQVLPETGSVCLPDPFAVSVETESLLGFAEMITLGVAGLPAGAVPVYSANPVAPGESAVITIDLSTVSENGDFPLTITAVADTLPMVERPVLLQIVRSDFSTVETTSPNGVAGVTALPTLEWKGAPDAASYDLEIATSPLFGNTVVDAAAGVIGSSYVPGVLLEDNTTYYWRVRGKNECATGDWTDPAAFSTKAQVCEAKAYSGGSINISGVGLPYIKVPVTILQNGIASEVRVNKVKGTHAAVAHIALRLKSPDGDSVTLMSGLLCGSNLIDLGFSDVALPGAIPCPPNTGFLYQPAEPLSAFAGKNIQGDWTLVLEVINSQGEGGTFQTWSFEYCAESIPNNPEIVVNDTLLVPPDGSRLIFTDKLLVTDSDNGAASLVFTIVRNTEFGFVSLNGTPLGTGDTFTMLDVMASSVSYTNTDADALYDYFTFGVSDGTGGFTGTPRFNIAIDPDAPASATKDRPAAGALRIYPNPASASFTVESAGLPKGIEEVELFDLMGQKLKSVLASQQSDRIEVPVYGLTPGMYLLRIHTGQGVFGSRIVIK